MIKKYLRKKFINWIVKDLFSAITAEDILKITGAGIYYKNKKLNEEQVDALQQDAERFSKSAIWKFLSEDAIYQANFIMYENSKSYEDMLFGKAVRYAVDIIDKKIKQLSKLK